MACTAAFLRDHDGDVSRLAHEYDLAMGRHPTLPLVVLNYRRGMTRSEPNQQDPHRRFVQADHPIVAECRGLVLEIDPTQNDRFVSIIAQGFARFWHITTPTDNKQHMSSTTPAEETPASLLALSAVNSGFDLSHPFQVGGTLSCARFSLCASPFLLHPRKLCCQLLKQP
jgi:hypothetical protein